MKLKLFSKHQKSPEYANDLVGCTGKLPIHKEFIKHKIILPELARLDQWYQSAYRALNHIYGNKLKDIFLQMPPYHYLYYGYNKILPMAGAVIASRDQSGRIYPYTIFRMLENPLAQEFPCAVPLIYKEYFDTLQKVYNFRSQTALPEIFNQINVLNKTSTGITRRQILEQTLNSLKKATLNDLWHSIAAQHNDLPLANFAQAIFNMPKPLQDPWGIKFPLPNNKSSIIFWLQLIESIYQTEYPIQAFWNQENLTVFLKPIPPKYFALLVDQQRTNPNLFDVITEAQNINHVSDAAKNTINNINTPLLDVLQKWSTYNETELINSI